VHRDSHLIFESYINEDWKDRIPKHLLFNTALVSASLGGLETHRTTQYINRVYDVSKQLQLMDELSADYQNAIMKNEPIDQAAKDFYDKTVTLREISPSAVTKVFQDLNLFKVRNSDMWDRIGKFDDVFYKHVDEQKKEEEAEKVATEPYLNSANDEEILTQYKQSWRAAGGGYGKGYMQQD
jgi:hypothetical protein